MHQQNNFFAAIELHQLLRVIIAVIKIRQGKRGAGSAFKKDVLMICAGNQKKGKK
jgi:hypothetical protein